MDSISSVVCSNLVGEIITTSQMMTLFLVLGTTAAMLIATRRRMREARNSPRTYAREQISRIKEEREVGTQITLAMTELEQVAREVNAQIDTKLVKLEALIRHADARIEKLQRTIRETEGQPVVDVTVDDEIMKTHEELTQSQFKTDDLKALVFNLADQGRSATEIAREVDRPAGEVELLLRLRPAISI